MLCFLVGGSLFLCLKKQRHLVQGGEEMKQTLQWALKNSAALCKDHSCNTRAGGEKKEHTLKYLRCLLSPC